MVQVDTARHDNLQAPQGGTRSTQWPRARPASVCGADVSGVRIRAVGGVGGSQRLPEWEALWCWWPPLYFFCAASLRLLRHRAGDHTVRGIHRRQHGVSRGVPHRRSEAVLLLLTFSEQLRARSDAATIVPSPTGRPRPQLRDALIERD